MDRPRFFFDHVQIAVSDLRQSAEDFQRRHRLTVIPGGRHPGRGTANAIVPLGESYLELIAVVDRAEAAPVPTSLRVARAVEEGRTFSAWAARCDDLDHARRSLQAAGWDLPDPVPGSRRRPDGALLSWRVQELVLDAAFSPLPFLIEWRLAKSDYPGFVPESSRPALARFSALRLRAPDPPAAEEKLAYMIDGDFEWSVETGPPGVAEVTLATDQGHLSIG